MCPARKPWKAASKAAVLCRLGDRLGTEFELKHDETINTSAKRHGLEHLQASQNHVNIHECGQIIIIHEFMHLKLAAI